jgi:hypothetical protein
MAGDFCQFERCGQNSSRLGGKEDASAPGLGEAQVVNLVGSWVDGDVLEMLSIDQHSVVAGLVTAIYLLIQYRDFYRVHSVWSLLRLLLLLEIPWG